LDEPFLVKALILMAASALAVAAFRRVGLPAILGYLAAGLAVGPHGLNLVAPDAATRSLAELGLIFLMFTAGLEFSVPAMLAARGDVFGAGALHVGLAGAAGAIVATLFGADLGGAVLVGGAVALSSTAVVVKQLSDQGDLGSSAGRRTLGLLLFEDLAGLLLLVWVGASAGGTDAPPLSVLAQVALGGVTLVGAAVLGRPFFRGVLAWVAENRSTELLLLAILLLALGAAWVAGLAGLAAPLGAFMAGMLVGESDIRHHAEDDIRPFRDVLLGLFFVTVGMGFDLGAAAAQPLAVMAWFAVFLLVKPAIILVVARLRRWPGEDGLRVAVAFANGGEFGLLLLTQAMAVGLASPSLAGPVALALLGSMSLAPVLMPRWSLLARRAAWLAPPHHATEISAASQELHGHVILCGCGRIGRPVAEALEAAGVAYVALEKDFPRYRQLRDHGLHVVFADASRLGVLAAAGIGRSRVLVLTFDTARDAERILDWAKADAPQARRLASASDAAAAAELVGKGAEVVFPENLAAGLGLADQTLLLCGLDQDAAARVVTDLRERLDPRLAGAGGV
jgi:CPA2 family monovalent cation:H+ antiporter-2